MATIDKIRLNGTEYTIVDGTKYTNEEVNAAIAAATSALSESFDEVLDDYVTNDELTAYTYDKATIDEKVGDAFDSDSYYDKTAVDGKLAEKVDVTAFTQYQGEVTSKFAEKVDVTAFTEYKGEVAAELADKLEAADIANYFDGASYNDSTKNIEFTHDGTVKATVSALPFIKDGMIDSVKIEGGKLVITWNADAGKEVTELEITQIFDASNYYTKEQADKQFGTLAEQTQLRSDVEDLMGEVATLEADKADTTAVTASINSLKQQVDGKVSMQDLFDTFAETKKVKQIQDSSDGKNLMVDYDNLFGTRTDPPVSIPFKTINGQGLLGEGEITIKQIDAYTKAEADGKFQTLAKATSDHNALQKDITSLQEGLATKADKATVEGTTLILG